MKILICILIVIGSSYIGYGVGNYYRIRQKFYEDLLNFLEYCDIQIEYYHTTIKKIFINYKNNNELSKEFNKFLEKIILQLSNDEKIIINSILLQENEKNQLNLYLNNLGKTDSENQRKIIEYNKSYFKNNYDEVICKSKNNSTLALKLGFFIGLAIAICLL